MTATLRLLSHCAAAFFVVSSKALAKCRNRAHAFSAFTERCVTAQEVVNG